MKSLFISFLSLITFFSSNAQVPSAWQLISDPIQKSVVKLSDKEDYLSEFKLYRLNRNLLVSKLDNQEGEFVILDIPNSSGRINKFKVFESSIMHPLLQEKYSNIRTFKGVGIDDPTATIRFSLSPIGFHALSSSGIRSGLYIEPYSSNESDLYIVFNKASVRDYESDFECLVETDILNRTNQYNSNEFSGEGDIDDQKLRKYRLALSCTGEYSQNFAGNGTIAQQKTNVLSAMVTSINRVNEIYERDLGIRLEFIANNDEIIYLDPSTDPWQNEFNTTTAVTIDNVIGVENYDIGHNYNDSGGGSAGCLGCVCSSSSQSNFHKGRAYTGSGNPTGDPFYIDYVAHEMGHQFYGWHTMNRCSRSGNNTEVEPGSGSSIMGYAGICNPNVQNQSDAHFNYVNIRDIGGYIKTGFNPAYNINVGVCDDGITILNQPPVVAAGNDYVIPANTPFVLTGLAEDIDGIETLTYNWSQNDPEEAPNNGTPQSTWTTGPLYRSLLPSNSPSRYFPALEIVVSGSLSSTWEVTPSVTRSLNFAFTVRDNGSGFVGDNATGQVATDEMLVEVVDTGQPFQVTSQNNQDVFWSSGTIETVTWNVAGTTTNGINANEVDILLSTDGGLNFDTILASGVPNNGSADINVPNIPSLTCRLIVKGSNHIFYSVNTTSFTIDYILETNCYTYNSEENLNLEIPDGIGQNEFGEFLVTTINVTENIIISDVDFNVDITHAYIEDLNIILQHPDGTQSVLFDRDCSDEDNLEVTFDDQALSDFICEQSTGETYRPTGTPLSNFDGKNSQGQWVLGIRDYYNEDSGILNDYSLSFCVTQAVLSNSLNDINLINFYPNPVNSNLYIETLNENLSYSLYDMKGRKIYSTNAKIIPMENLSTGTYLLRITGDNHTTFRRVIKK